MSPAHLQTMACHSWLPARLRQQRRPQRPQQGLQAAARCTLLCAGMPRPAAAARSDWRRLQGWLKDACTALRRQQPRPCQEQHHQLAMPPQQLQSPEAAHPPALPFRSCRAQRPRLCCPQTHPHAKPTPGEQQQEPRQLQRMRRLSARRTSPAARATARSRAHPRSCYSAAGRQQRQVLLPAARRGTRGRRHSWRRCQTRRSRACRARSCWSRRACSSGSSCRRPLRAQPRLPWQPTCTRASQRRRQRRRRRPWQQPRCQALRRAERRLAAPSVSAYCSPLSVPRRLPCHALPRGGDVTIRLPALAVQARLRRPWQPCWTASGTPPPPRDPAAAGPAAQAAARPRGQTRQLQPRRARALQARVRCRHRQQTPTRRASSAAAAAAGWPLRRPLLLRQRLA